MIEAIFLKLVNMSLTTGWMILAVIVLRALLTKAPKYIRCIMWCLVGIRLIFPFSIESIFSLVPNDNVISSDIIYSVEPAIDSGIAIVDDVMNPIIAENFTPDVGVSANPLQIASFVGACIWIAGMVTLLLYSVVAYIKLRIRVREAVYLQDNVFLCEKVVSPFVLGVFKPRIYIPYHLNEEEQKCVIAHEKAHIKRGDHILKLLAFVLLTVYWFNPMMWLAYVLLCKDIELACDEKVLNEIGSGKKRIYSETLLKCSVPNLRITAYPLTFGEVNVKQRIRNVIHYKRPTFWILSLSVIAIVLIVLCFMTNPKEIQVSDSKEIVTKDYETEESVEQIAITTPVMSQEILSGADGPILDFASEDMVVFHDYYGLFIYRLNEGIVGAIDLATIGCQYTQGEKACEVLVEKDGSKVYMHVMNEADMYVYDVKQASLYKKEYNVDEINGFYKIKDISDCIDPDYTVLRSQQCVAIEDYHYLESGSGLPIDLAWVAVDSYTREIEWCVQLFEEY